MLASYDTNQRLFNFRFMEGNRFNFKHENQFTNLTKLTQL